MNPEALFKHIEEIRNRLDSLEKRPTPATSKEVQELKKIGIKLDAYEVANILKPSMLDKLPDKEDFQDANSSFVHQIITQVSAIKKQATFTIERFTWFIFGSTVLLLVMAIWLAVIFYNLSNKYETDAYKYQYYKKRIYQIANSPQDIKDFVAVDNFAQNNFKALKTFVDTTVTAENLMLNRQLNQKIKSPKKK